MNIDDHLVRFSSRHRNRSPVQRGSMFQWIKNIPMYATASVMAASGFLTAAPAGGFLQHLFREHSPPWYATGALGFFYSVFVGGLFADFTTRKWREARSHGKVGRIAWLVIGAIAILGTLLWTFTQYAGGTWELQPAQK